MFFLFFFKARLSILNLAFPSLIFAVLHLNLMLPSLSDMFCVYVMLVCKLIYFWVSYLTRKMKALLNHHDVEINAGHVILVSFWAGDPKGGVLLKMQPQHSPIKSSIRRTPSWKGRRDTSIILDRRAQESILLELSRATMLISNNLFVESNISPVLEDNSLGTDRARSIPRSLKLHYCVGYSRMLMSIISLRNYRVVLFSFAYLLGKVFNEATYACPTLHHVHLDVGGSTFYCFSLFCFLSCNNSK